VKTFVWLFAIAALFGLAVDIVYWFSSRVEPAGTALLGVMTIALTFAAFYANVAERNARLSGDDPGKKHEDVAGEEIEIFTTASPYPILIALCVVFLLAGAVWSPLIGAIALVAMLVCLWHLGRESSRV
jgi:integral membrane sensor domain MASE1